MYFPNKASHPARKLIFHFDSVLLATLKGW